MQARRVGCIVVVYLSATLQTFGGDDGSKTMGSAQSPAAILDQALLAAGQGPIDVLFRGQLAVDFARAGRVARGFELAAQLPDQPYREWILCQISAVLAAAGDRARAVQTAKGLHTNRRCQAATWLAIQQAEAGDLAGGLATIGEILGNEPDAQRARRWLAQTLENEGKHAEASRIYESTGDLLDQARALNAIAKERLRAGDLAGARRAADQTSPIIKRIPLPPGHHTGLMTPEPEMYRRHILMEIAEKQAEAKDWNSADTTIDYILVPHWRVRTIARIAALQVRAGQRERARAMFAKAFAEATEGPGQGYLFLEIAQAQTAAGDRETARKTFLRALRKVRDHVPSNQAYAVSLQAETGDIEGALQTIKAIPEITIKDDALRSIVRALARASQTSRALEIAGNIVAPQAKNSALLEIGEIQVKAGDRAGAIATLRKIGPIAGAQPFDLIPRIARSRAAAGDVSGALDWANAQTSPELKSQALIGVAEGMLPDFPCPVSQQQSF